MSLLSPNTAYTLNGVAIKEKIIPDGTRWTDGTKAKKAGFYQNALYKKEKKLTGDSGNALYVSIHNTNYLKNVEDDGEQYTRATYNENMGSARVHFYVNDTCAWQNLRAGTGLSINDPEGSAEVGWHAGDGSIEDGGNMTSLAIEIIMGESDMADKKSKDNGARIAAWLLWKHGLTIDRLVTHTYWVNKYNGKKFTDVDVQCTNPIYGEKWCPAYIFGSTNPKAALANWRNFKGLVEQYLSELRKADNTSAKIECDWLISEINEGDLVKLSDNATYYNGNPVPAWVKKMNWYVCDVNGDRAVIDKNESGKNSIRSPINIKYLSVVKSSKVASQSTVFEPYLVKVVTDELYIYKNAGIENACVGCIKDKGVYTIVAEEKGTGATKWGKLKSGAGWIALEYTKKV